MRLDISSGWHSLGPILQKKYGKQDWFNRIQIYLINRHAQIQQRLLISFNYVDFHPKNATTFSYEYASLLRDIGSVFGSFLDNLIKSALPATKGELNINNFCAFLCNEVDFIEEICAEMEAEYNQRYLFPFHNIKKITPHWWKAYNNIKHTDIENLQDGCLSNILYGFASLSVLRNLSIWTKFNTIFEIGVHRDLKVDNETLWRDYVFPIC
ncbi:hypothetical protein MUO79_01565 [Candidatus Bathyarchaeota archaeon]|nr:hypothetical protein [Candidatus Bathyarchaeota archaeon]